MTPHLKTRLKRTAILSAAALLAGALIGFAQVSQQNASVVNKGPGAEQAVPGSQVGGDFTLIDHTGKTVTQADYPGYKLIYFGFTYCPAICPTELQKITQALKDVGPLAAQIQPLFITIDPERDTAGVMKDYVALFDPRLAGLTGTPGQIAETLKSYKIYARKVQEEGMSDYTMDHSSFIYLMAPDNTLVSIYRTEDTAAFIAEDIRAKLPPA